MRCGIYVRVSTEDQRDNGYSIDSQLRMCKEYCTNNNYLIVDIYNDAGHSGKDLMRPNMQRLLKDIKLHKIDKLVAIKVDRITRNNYDGFWLLNYCEQNDVKIELILEPYDVSTANGEMIFGMNLVFGQRERKEIGARTKRAMEEMALNKVHPNKSPFGYCRNKVTGHLEIEPIESEIVKEIFSLCKEGKPIRRIAAILRENNRYIKKGKWDSNKVKTILNNTIYTGTFAFGRSKRKPQEIKYIKDYCTPLIDDMTWKITRKWIEKNKHSQFGEHIHIFTGLVRCPYCNCMLSSSETFKTWKGKRIIYFHLRCKNSNCKGYNYHYNSDKIEEKLKRILNELTRFMYDNSNSIIVSNSSSNDEIKNIEKAIYKLKLQEKKLVDLYLSSTVDVETINHKNSMIKNEINNLTQKLVSLDPNNESKEYAFELVKKLDCDRDDSDFIFKNNLEFSFLFDSLNKKAKKSLVHRLIDSFEIERDEKYNIYITSIKFTEEFLSKSSKEYISYLNDLLNDNSNFGVTYKEKVDKDKLNILKENYTVMSMQKMENNIYSKEEIDNFVRLIKEHFYVDGVINCPYVEENNVVDNLVLIPKNEIILERK